MNFYVNNMLNNLYLYLKSKFPITNEEFELFKEVSTVKKLRKRQYLLQEGDLWRYNAFVSSGMVRTYRVDEKGQEHIMQFSPENWWAGDRYSYLNDLPARFNIEALEDSEIILIPKGDYENLIDKIPGFNHFTRGLLERSFVALQNRIHAGISYTAEEKYLDFVKTYPDIFNRVPQHMIASYLGLTPETLSRVRNQMIKK
jgi:CRP-like cAMP-binding protein